MTAVVIGTPYAFTPVIANAGGAALTFAIENAPHWAAFSTATGELSGTPTAGDVGTYSNIVISVSDGTTTATLPAFAINVTESADGSVTLSWLPPTENTNGTPLTDLAGYVINYGTQSGALNQSAKVASPGVTTYVVSNLTPGTWYFSVSAYSTANIQSPPSGVASVTVN